jgi:ubiquitin-protein ligase
MDWKTIAVTALINAVITGTFFYVIQKKIDSAFQKSLYEYQIKFSRNYPKTLEILETL